MRIHDVRLATGANVDTIYLSSLTLIPIDAGGETDNAKLIYDEDDFFAISNSESYVPSSTLVYLYRARRPRSQRFWDVVLDYGCLGQRTTR